MMVMRAYSPGSAILAQVDTAKGMSARKAAIVTGSATGVGAATALAMAHRGYDVLINYSKSEREARESVAACQAAGADVLLVCGDVADDAACRQMAAAALTRWNRLDALVNCAGIAGTANQDALDAQEFHKVFGVNVIGAYQMVRACKPHLKAANGAIVNVSSIAGVLGNGSSAAYVTSKGALNSLTLYLARSLAPEIRVNAVCPGLITTRWLADSMTADGYEQAKARYEQSTLLGRACTAEDVAAAILWLIEGAQTVTGELLQLDSGMHLGRAPTAAGHKP
jgi:3-oxoacyl-[acyl-carrier protein] reductase